MLATQIGANVEFGSHSVSYTEVDGIAVAKLDRQGTFLTVRVATASTLWGAAVTTDEQGYAYVNGMFSGTGKFDDPSSIAGNGIAAAYFWKLSL